MTSVNELMQSEAIRHQTEIRKYTNAEVLKILAVLNRADRRMLAELAERLERMSPATFTMERLEAMLASVRMLSAEATRQAQGEFGADLRDFVSYEAEYQTMMLTAHVPVQVSIAAVNAEAAYAAAMSRPFQGVLLRDVWQDLDARKMKIVRQTIAQGFVESKTTDQVIRELRGTRAKGYADGLLEAPRKEVEAVVRTALSHTAGMVQDRAAEANADIIKAVKWSATLDLRTSPICRPRDGKLYHPVTHKPIGHDMQWLGGPGRAHWRCRSGQAFVLKSMAEMGIDAPDVVVVGKTRASMDGQVPADTTYGEWLKGRTAAQQDKVLGETRGRLFRQGKLPLERMYDDKGSFLTLDELRARDAEAFRRAGL